MQTSINSFLLQFLRFFFLFFFIGIFFLWVFFGSELDGFTWFLAVSSAISFSIFSFSFFPLQFVSRPLGPGHQQWSWLLSIDCFSYLMFCPRLQVRHFIFCPGYISSFLYTWWLRPHHLSRWNPPQPQICSRCSRCLTCLRAEAWQVVSVSVTLMLNRVLPSSCPACSCLLVLQTAVCSTLPLSPLSLSPHDMSQDPLLPQAVICYAGRLISFRVILEFPCLVHFVAGPGRSGHRPLAEFPHRLCRSTSHPLPRRPGSHRRLQCSFSSSSPSSFIFIIP